MTVLDLGFGSAVLGSGLASLRLKGEEMKERERLTVPNKGKVKVRKKERESCCPARESALPFGVETGSKIFL